MCLGALYATTGVLNSRKSDRKYLWWVVVGGGVEVIRGCSAPCENDFSTGAHANAAGLYYAIG